MTWFRLPLFVWSHYATSLIMVLGTPVLAITIAARRGRAAVQVRHLRPRARRRPDPLPAPLLVLLAPGGLHHGAARAWASSASWWRPSAGSRSSATRVVAFSSLGHRDPRLPRVGPPHVRRGPIGLRGAHLLAPELPRRHPVGHQGLQLDGDDVQGLGVVGDADALRDRVHRAVHDRRADGPLPGGGRPRRARAPTPTSSSRTSTTSWSAARSWRISAGSTTGGRRSPAARTTSSSRKVSAAIDLLRLQPDVLPAVHPRLPRHAAAIPRVPAGVPGAERAVVGRRVAPRRRVPAADGLSGLVAPLRQAASARTRGAPSASSGRRRRRRRRRISRRRRSSPGTRTTTRRAWRDRLSSADRGSGDRRSGGQPSSGARAPLRQPRAAERRRNARHVGVPRHRGAVLRRAVRAPTPSTATGTQPPSPTPAITST